MPATADWSLDQDGLVKLKEVLQDVFSGKMDGTAVDFSLEKFVVDQGFANLRDTDMRIFHLPDLTALERLDGDGFFLRRVLHGHQFSRAEIQKRGKSLQKQETLTTNQHEWMRIERKGARTRRRGKSFDHDIPGDDARRLGGKTKCAFGGARH